MKNKNFLKRLSAMITALCIMIPLSTASEIGTVNSADFDVIDTYNSWREAYRDELLSFMYSNSYVEPYEDYSSSNYSSYTLHDLNNDDIPELIINAKPVTLAANYIYTFYDSQIVSLVDGMSLESTISFCADEQLIKIIGAAGRSYFNRFARINNGQLEIIDNFIYGPGAAGKAYYTRNGNEISEKEFEQFKSKYDAKSWEDINIWNSNSFDDLSVEKNGLTYDYYFDYYQASEYNGTATTLTIPDTVNGFPVSQLGDDLLWHNSTVKTLNLPASIKSMYYNAFNSSTSATITIDNNPYWSSSNDVLYNNDMSALVKYPPAKDVSSYTFPSSVMYIEKCAFSWCTKLKNIVIPETVRNISEDAFFWCPNLSSVTILNSDCNIGYSDTTFCNSRSDGVGHYLGVIRGYEGSTAQEFAESQDITFISLGEDPSKVTTTTTTTTSTTTSSTTSTSTTTTTTTTTTASTTTTTVTTTATTLTTTTTTSTSSTTTPTTTTTATGIVLSGKCGDNLSFSLDSNGKLIIRGKGNPFDYYPWCGSLDVTEVIIENGVTSIGDYEFSGCSNLTSITIPNSVTSIGDRAFMGCSNLTSITIPNSVTSIGNGAFWDCSKLTSITIPNNVTSIDNSAFWGCSSLTSVTIPNSVTNIGDYEFSGCSNLTSITIRNSVTSIGNGAFLDCSELTSITIPNNVTSIGELAFMGCSSLTSVNIPDSVSIIGNSTFLGCDKLTITCYTGSFAEEYAKEHNIPFKEIKGSSLFGDVNNDGSVSIADTVSLQNFLLGRTKTLNNWKNADLCEDNRLDVFDMIVMRRLLIDRIPN